MSQIKTGLAELREMNKDPMILIEEGLEEQLHPDLINSASIEK